MEEIIIELLSALVGSLGFSMMFNSPKRTLLPAIIGGMLGWGVYLIFEAMNLGVFISTVISAVFCQIYSEVFSRIQKTPRTVFYIPSIIPLVPGGSLYYTVYHAALTDWAQVKYYGSMTVQVAFGIAVGSSFVSAIVLLMFPKKNTTAV